MSENPTCPGCAEEISGLDNKSIGFLSIVDDAEWEFEIRGDCPECGAELAIYGSSPEAHFGDGHPSYIAEEYDGEVVIEFTSNGAEHTYRFGADWERDVAWPQYMIQQGETYRVNINDVSEWILNAVRREFGLEPEER